MSLRLPRLLRLLTEDGGYRIDGDFFLPPVQLTLAEALALSVLGSQLAAQGQLPFLQDAWQAVTKVRGQLPAALRDELAGSDGRFRVQTARVSPQAGCEPFFEMVRRAIAERRKLRCTYDGGNHANRPLLLRPYALFFSQRAWYVIGYSEAAGAERSLKLNRIKQLVPTDRPFMIPDDWSLERSLGCAWRMIRGGKRYHVVIRFDKEVGRNVGDTLWHPTQTITAEPNGACRFECDVDGLDEIVWWVLGYGPHAVVIEPDELREQVQDLVVRTGELYQHRPLRKKRRRSQIDIAKMRGRHAPSRVGPRRVV